MNIGQVVFKLPSLGEFKVDNLLTKDLTPIYISGRRTAWKENLIKALSRYCGCTFLTEKDYTDKTTKYYLVGRKYNITVMRVLWNWLTTRIHDTAKGDAIGSGRIIINSYCLGYVEGLEETINTSPSIIKTTQQEQEAKHYMKLIHYTVDYAPPCNNSHIDNIAFELGKFKGKALDLMAITQGLL